MYNIVKYLKDEFPTETIYTDLRIYESGESYVPDRCSVVRDTGGLDGEWYRYTQATIQIITRDKDMPKARKYALDIYNELHGRFGLLLPAVTVDSETYPELQTSQISGLQRPSSLGADDNGRYEYTTNYLIIFVNDGGY